MSNMKALLRTICTFLILIGIHNQAFSQDASRWQLTNNGGIAWQVKSGDSHMDHMEMSGMQTSAITTYGVENGFLKQKILLVFPMLRLLPNNTKSNLVQEIDRDTLGRIKINGQEVIEKPNEFRINGILSWQSKTADGIVITHQLYPSTSEAAFVDKIELKNTTNKDVSIDLPKVELSYKTDADKGVYGAYIIEVNSNKNGSFNLKANQSIDYAIVYTGRRMSLDARYISPEYELQKRQKLIDETLAQLVFESPDEVINRAFAFAKIRAVESIFSTKGGLMHAPGGGRYYAAIWANDQAEYANPFFPFLGNIEGNESAMNSFRHFARYMNDDYIPIPSSIISEGVGKWNGAKDRGDMAMIAYGATRFALASGNIKTGRELWPLIEWCLEYSKRKVNNDGVVTSNSDELEGRFPAGKANLNTSSLYYDGLKSAVYLGKELNVNPELLDNYAKQAVELEKSIETYFGRTVDSYETYQYYMGNDVLRAWIATPLTVGIFNRSQGTINALFSDKLWTEDGLASASGSTTFWDRSTLYALRGVFAAGDTKRAMTYLEQYSKRRLLGEHVPYAVEAYPEGNQTHLSAESALYCRIITEGMFGIRPTGFSEFTLTPRLPDDWESMALRNIKAFDQSFDIEVKAKKNKLFIKVYNADKVFLENTVEKNQAIKVHL